MKGKLNGLSLFSGYAGIDIGLSDYVRPLLYCEIERYAQGILLSRMEDELIPFSPIWGDVRTLDGNQFKGLVDIVYGGFPCQDTSNAGKGKGLGGERSGLFFEIVRICREASPKFVFLENVPGIRKRGSFEVQESLASIGYDTRFGLLSAAEIGANHRRDRYFCLAIKRDVSDPLRSGLGGKAFAGSEENNQRVGKGNGGTMPAALNGNWWAIGSELGRVDNGTPFRVDRIKALGNGVVPLQVKKAFEILMGVK